MSANLISLTSAGGFSTTGNVVAGNIFGNVSNIVNGNSNVSVATGNGNVTVTSNGTNTWNFDTTGTLTLPEGGTIDNATEIVTVTLDQFTDAGYPGTQVFYKVSDTLYEVSPGGPYMTLVSGIWRLKLSTATYYDSTDLITWGTVAGGLPTPVGTLGTLASMNLGVGGNVWQFGADGTTAFPNNTILTNETALKIATSPTTTYTFNQAYWEALNGDITRMFTPTGNAQYFSCTVTANQDGTYTVGSTTGNSFAPGNWFKVPGNELGGVTPANDIQINIATVDGEGVILTTTITGTAVGKQWQFGEDGSLTLPIGVSIDDNVSPLYPKIIADSGKLFSVQGQGANGSAALAWSLNPNTDTEYAAVGVNKGGGDDLAKVVLTAGNTTPTLKVWKFDETGNFTFPSGNLVINSDSTTFSNAAVISSADHNLITLSTGVNGGLSSLWVEDYANVGTSNIAAVYANPTPGSGIVRIAVGQNGGNAGPYLWDFDGTGNATFPANGTTNLHDVVSVGLATFSNVKIGGNLNYEESANLIVVEDKDGFADIIAQNKNSGGNASMNIVLVNNDPGNVYMAVGVNSSTFTPLYNTLFEIPDAGYVSHSTTQVMGPQSAESGTSKMYFTYNSGSYALELNDHGAIGWGASYNGNLTEGNFGNTGQVLTSAGANSPPTWSNFSTIANGTSNVTIPTANGNVTITSNSGNTWIFDNAGNLTIPGNSGGLIKTVANGAIGITAMNNGTDNPAQLMSWRTTENNPDTIVSTYANSATVMTNVTGTLNTWTFDNDGNLTLPSNGYLRVTSGIISTGASPAPSLSGFSSVSAINISASGNITGNKFIGNGALLTNVVQALIKPNNLLYVAKNGSDITGTGSINAPYQTVQAAIDAAAGDTATTIILAPGSYVENLTIANVANSLNITGSGLAESAINGNIVISGTSDNIEFDNFRVSTGRITHSATGYWSVLNMRFSANTGITKTSTSTIKIFNTDLGASGTGNILLQGGKTNIYSSQIFNVQISGANTEVNFLQCDTVILPTVISGNVNFFDTNIVSSGSGNSLNAISGYVTLKNCLSITPSRALAPIGFGAGASYSYGDSAFDFGNSTFAGTAIVQQSQFQAINVRSGNITSNGLVSVTGNITGGNVLTVGLVSATGNVSGNFFIGNGSQLTGIAASYGNANVATFLAAYGSNTVSTTGNITSGNILTSGLVSATGNIVTAGNFVGNGAALTNVTVSVAGNIIGTQSNVTLVAGAYNWAFDNTGNLTLPGNTFAVNYANNTPVNAVTKFESFWTVPVGNSTQSFTVNTNETYYLWVDCNITNGILTWNATATVTNTNVPVVGAQYAWVYNGGGTPIDFTSIPDQFVGTANTIVRSNVSPSATTNKFDFGINNASGNSQTVRYGWIAIS